MEETLGQPYSGVVEIVTRDLNAEVITLAGADCVLEIDRGPERRRRFGGIVTKITNIGDQQEKDLAQIHFAPALSALDYGANSRSFEEMTTVQIVEAVLKEGLKEFYRPFKISLKNQQEPRIYCVQHEETDLAFITRLMADEGMFYSFEQEEDQEVVVLVDANESCPEQQTMGYEEDAESEEEEPKYDNSFSTLGQTYTDVTPPQEASEDESQESSESNVEEVTKQAVETDAILQGEPKAIETPAQTPAETPDKSGRTPVYCSDFETGSPQDAAFCQQLNRLLRQKIEQSKVFTLRSKPALNEDAVLCIEGTYISLVKVYSASLKYKTTAVDVKPSEISASGDKMFRAQGVGAGEIITMFDFSSSASSPENAAEAIIRDFENKFKTYQANN